MYFLQSCSILYIIFKFLDIITVTAGTTCPSIKIPNGRARLRSSGRFVDFKCKKDFQLVGVKLAVCLTNGQWSQNIPTCVGTTCTKPDKRPNLVVEELHKGGVLRFTCANGLIRSGPDTLMCDGEKWDGETPTCIESEVMGCDFENAYLCGWSQDANDDFNWIRITGKTPTANTGPRFDHTTNSPEGHYIFMESSAPQKPGQKTRIISPSYAPEKMKEMCLEFYYHMFGPDGEGEVGNLDVYVKPESWNTTQINTAQNIFHVGGNQGDEWMRADTDIPQLNESINFVFQATRLESWTGDIAIDDIKFIKCVDRITTAMPIIKKSSGGTPVLTTSRKQKLTTQKTLTSTTTRNPKQLTTTAASILAPTRAEISGVTKMMVALNTTVWSKIQTTAKNIVSTKFRTPMITTNKIKIDSSTASSLSLNSKGISTQQMTSHSSSTLSYLKSTNPIENQNKNEHDNSNIIPDNNNGGNSEDVNSGNNTDNSGKNNRVNSVSDYIDYTNVDSSSNRNTSASTNDTQTPYVDYDYNKLDSSGNNINSEMDSAIDGLLADAGSVKNEQTSQKSFALIPLIVGLVASLLVGITVVALLAWIWVRSQRQKQDKSHDDQMNIITEYVETNLSI